MKNCEPSESPLHFGELVTNILQLNSSLSGESGQSSRLASEFATALATATGATVQVRDLAHQLVPHLTAERFAAFTTPASERTLEQQRYVAESDALVEELRRADVLVFGVPMYNFGVPSTLKAYFDHVARAGVTFRYTPDGPVGLLGGKRAYVFATRGGRYAGTEADLQTAYLKKFLGFLGIDDVEFIYAEGLALGAEQREQAVAAAVVRIGQLAA
jgi:FMN-dependent NADH-azoreductase